MISTLIPIGVMKFDSRFNVSNFVLLSKASAKDCGEKTYENSDTFRTTTSPGRNSTNKVIQKNEYNEEKHNLRQNDIA